MSVAISPSMKFKCLCGCFLAKTSIKGHLNSRKHFFLLQKIESSVKENLQNEMNQLFDNSLDFNSAEYLEKSNNLKMRFENLNLKYETNFKISSNFLDLDFMEVRNFSIGGYYSVFIDKVNQTFDVRNDGFTIRFVIVLNDC